ncbi:nucleotidyltransferase domain-containing protein [Paenibacillus pabuli]|uniref:nucleotidyltransferase domain-containing protein n=1 Tax=Paenibacillus pabuli TaxID=1472 RepID=UPI0032423D68
MQAIRLNDLTNLRYNDDYTIRSIVERLSQYSVIHNVILFGSRARGTHRDDSDTDVMIITETDIPFDEELWSFFEAINERNGTDVRISPISVAEWNNPTYEESIEIRQNIYNEGIIIADYI